MANQTIYPYGTDGELPSNIGIIDDVVTGGRNKALSAEQGKILQSEIAECVSTQQYEDQKDDLLVVDNEGYIGMQLLQGHILSKNFRSPRTPFVNIQQEQEEKFCVSDSGGNVILEISQGHIKTRNFDSSLSSQSNSASIGGYKSLVCGDLKNGTVSSSNIFSQNDYCLISDTLGLPYENVSFIVCLNADYKLRIMCGYIDGDNGTKYTSTIGPFVNGDVAQVPLVVSSASVQYIRVEVSRKDGGVITLSDNIGLNLLYKCYYDIVDTNDDITDVIQAFAAKRGASNIVEHNNKIVLIHGSDIHADWERLNTLYDYAASIKADAILLTGDFVAHNYHDGLTPMLELSRKSSIPTLISCGNHEVGFKYGSIDFEVSDSDVYNYVFSELAQSQEYLKSSGTISDKPYYYYDIANKNVRVISVYQYINGTQTAQSGYTNLRWVQHYDQDEIDWLCDTLLSTPSGYGVVVLCHTPELSMNGGKISGNDLFFPVNWTFGDNANSVTNGYVLREILDAFIAKTSLTKTYTQSGTPSSFDVDVDFSSVPSTTKFIAIVNGHYHQDAIGLVSGANQRQVQLNIASTAGLYYQSKKFDCVRNTKNQTGDAFNVYVIDIPNHIINGYRIGTHRTLDGRNRQSISIDYLNN